MCDDEEDNDDDSEMKRVAKMMNQSHGYGGAFAYDTSEDKAIMEASTAQEWADALEAEFGIEVTSLTPNPDDPPDMHATIGGRRYSIELVQMIDAQHKERASRCDKPRHNKKKKVLDESPYTGKLFDDMQWTRERFIAKLNDLIAAKGEKYAARGLHIDVLLIHSGETWLYSRDAFAWLEGAEIARHPSIGAVHLLFEYETGRGVDHWPLGIVYGDLPQQRSAPDQ